MLLGGMALISAIITAITCATSGAFLSLAWLWVLPVTFIGSFLGLFILAFLFLVVVTAFVDTSKPQGKDSKFFRVLIALYVDLICTILRAHCHATGLEKTPRDGRFLLVCNHISILDVVVLMKYFRHSQLAFISKRENSTMFVVGKVMHKVSCQLINRENDREAIKTILKCIQLIKDDEVSIAVFPEGYTSLDGLLHPFRHGVFKIAQRAKVPIVVCTVQNTNKIFHNFAHFKHTDVYLHLLDVIPASDFEGHTTVDMGTRVHQMMAEDLGPDMVLKTEE